MTAPAQARPAEQKDRVPTIGPEHGLPMPASLTRDPAKRVLFGADAWFRDGWDDLTRVAGPEGAEALAHDHALVLLKPDAVARRLLAPTLDWLQLRGAEVVASAAVDLDRHVMREMWQYQLNASTRDRRDLADQIVAAGPSLLLILRPEPSRVPASVRVSAWKGPADPARRAPGQLRHVLGGGNFLLNFVHAADEPADLARELAILLDAAPRERIIRRLLGSVSRNDAAEARSLAAVLEAASPAHDLELATALAGLERALTDASRRAPHTPEADALRRQAAARLAQVHRGETADWRGVLADLRAAGAELAPWDAIVLGTVLMDHTEPGVAQVLGSAARTWWSAEAE